MESPERMTDDEMQLQLKEWLVAGMVVWGTRTRKGPHPDNRKLETFEDPRLYYSLRVYEPEGWPDDYEGPYLHYERGPETSAWIYIKVTDGLP